jgi:hypothetical protein
MFLRQLPALLLNAAREPVFLIRLLNDSSRSAFHAPRRALSARTVRYQRGGFAAVARNNLLYLVIGALVVVVAVMGYQLYQDRHQPEGLHINVGPGGLSIQDK